MSDPRQCGTGMVENRTPARRIDTAGASNRSGAGWAVADSDGLPDQVLTACQRSDPAAQRAVFEYAHRRVFGLMIRMLGAQDAPDVTQTVFLQVFRKIATFRGESTFDTWLWRLAVNEALQHLRKRRRARIEVPDVNLDAFAAEPVAMSDERDLLEQALARLSPELRCLFLLREKEGLSYRELATALDLPEGTIASRLNQARRELKRHLLDLGWEP